MDDILLLCVDGSIPWVDGSVPSLDGKQQYTRYKRFSTAMRIDHSNELKQQSVVL